MDILQQIAAAEAELALLQKQLETELVFSAYDCSQHPSKKIAEFTSDATIENPSVLEIICAPKTIVPKTVRFVFGTPQQDLIDHSEGTAPLELVGGSNNDITKLVGKKFSDGTYPLLVQLFDGPNMTGNLIYSKSLSLTLKTKEVVTPPETKPFVRGMVALSSFKPTDTVQTNAGAMKYLDALKHFKIGLAREWISTGLSGASDAPSVNSLQRFKWILDAGIELVICLTLPVNSTAVPKAADVEAWAEQTAKNLLAAGMQKAILELGNEPNLQTYWPGTIQQYVQNYLNPAYPHFNSRGIKIASAGVSWNPDVIKQIMSFHPLCDFVSHHPYRDSGPDLLANLNKAISYVGDKKLLLTEFNMSRTGYTKAGQTEASRLSIMQDQVKVLTQLSANIHGVAYHLCWSSPTASNAFWITGNGSGVAWTLFDKDHKATPYLEKNWGV